MYIGSHNDAWPTGPGCRFAGFCAIVSVYYILSVYTLLVITVEQSDIQLTS